MSKSPKFSVSDNQPAEMKQMSIFPDLGGSGFETFGLSEFLLLSLGKLSFSRPTPIQEQCIPLILKGHDLIAQAQTGSGKTAAFAIPLVQKLKSFPEMKALILVPTRELATQVSDFIFKLTQGEPSLRPAQFIGGVDKQRQIRSLKRNPRILVATPGRLNDLLRDRVISLAQVKFLVLDEADRMLDMGFYPQIKEVVKHLPQDRQSFLFSATFSKEILKLSGEFLKSPKSISTMKEEMLRPKINRIKVDTTVVEKRKTLVDLLPTIQGKTLIFARTKLRTDRLAKDLRSMGLKVTLIHGDRSQAQRQKAIEGLKRGEFQFMVATDVAARGIDIADVINVVNYDLPENADDFVHRVGRTGRFGATGNAFSLVTPDQFDLWESIERKMNKK